MNNILFQLGNITIYKYSVCILSGVISAIIVIIINNKRYNINKDDLSDIIFYTLLIGILGARIYYVIFNLDYYLKNPQEIIMISNGGLAIHGGLLLGLITIIYLTKKRNIELFNLLDIISPSIILAQSIGRWGNYFNQEAYGSIVTKSFLKSLHIPNFIIENMKIEGAYHHPCFLYESILCLIGFIILEVLFHKKLKSGTIFSTYLIYYGIIRFFIESLRTDSLIFFGLKQAQLISIIFIIFGIIILIKINKKEKE